MIIKNIIDNAPFSMILKISDNLDYHENEGFLYCYNVIMGRTGVQKYRAYELGLTGNDIIDVYRDEKDVFHEDTLKSLIGKSVVYNHPVEGDVTSKNYKMLEAGTVLDVWRDGDNIVGNIVVKDETTIQAIQDGVRELSLGYNAKIVEEDGKYYQKEIRMNHLAVLEAGRAGNARIIDKKGVDEPMPNEKKSFIERIKGLFTIKDGVIVENTFEDGNNVGDPKVEFKDVELENGEKFSFNDGKRMYVYHNETVTTEIYDDETGESTEETISISKRVYKRVDDNGEIKGFYDEDGNLIDDIESIKLLDDNTTNDKNKNKNEDNTNNIQDTSNENGNENHNNINEKGGTDIMKLTFKDAMAELKELQKLENSEFKTNAINELNARAIADGLGSILPIEPEEKPNENEKGNNIADTAGTANNLVDGKKPNEPKVYNFGAETEHYNKFFDGLLAVNHKSYDDFKDNARKYVDVKDKDVAEGVI